MGSNYNDAKRAFLQAIMARGAFTLSEGKSVLAAILTVQEEKEITTNEITQDTFDSYIVAAGEAVSCFEFEIYSSQHQITKTKTYAFVNSVSDSLTQLATLRTPDELLYIKRLLDAIFDTNNCKRKEVMAIRSMQALESKIRKGNTEKGLSQTEAETLLSNLEKEKWLERSQKGFYSLAPRALMELRTWLQDTYNDSYEPDSYQKIKFCKACRDIVTVGQRCSDLECNVRLHNICEAAYWKSRSSRHCPKCNLEWNGETYVGERAVTSVEENLRRKSRGEKRPMSTERDQSDSEDSEGRVDGTSRPKRISRRDLSNNSEISFPTNGGLEV